MIEGDAVFRQPGHRLEAVRVLGVDILRDQPFRDTACSNGAAPMDAAPVATREAARSAPRNSSACSSIQRR